MSLHCDFNAPLRTKSRKWYWKRVHACPKSSVAHPQKHQSHHFFTKSFVFPYQNWQFLVVTTPHLHRKSGSKRATVEVRLVPKSILWAPPRAKNYSKTYFSSDITVQSLHLLFQKLCIPTSMHPSYSKYEIISFSIVKLTIPGGHDTSFASKIRPKTGYGRGPVGVVHAYFVPTPTPWTFSRCKTM